MTLDKIKIGEEGIITNVGGQGILRGRLLDMGLIPNTRITVVKLAPMGDPIEIRLRGYELTIRKADAALIEVKNDALPLTQTSKKSKYLSKDSAIDEAVSTETQKEKDCLINKNEKLNAPQKKQRGDKGGKTL